MVINGALNMRGKYILVGKIINRGGINYKTYGLDGVTRVVSSAVFKKQAESYKIINCVEVDNKLIGLIVQLEAIPVYNNIIKSEYKIYSEEQIIKVVIEQYNKNKLRIVARILKGKICIGYIVEDVLKNRTAYRRDKTIKLIQKGYIVNATYQSYKGTDIIKGIEFRLCELPAVLYNKLKTISTA